MGRLACLESVLLGWRSGVCALSLLTVCAHVFSERPQDCLAYGGKTAGLFGVWRQEHCEPLFVCRTCADRLVQAVLVLLWRAPNSACLPASIGAFRFGLFESACNMRPDLFAFNCGQESVHCQQGSAGTVTGYSSQRRHTLRACTTSLAGLETNTAAARSYTRVINHCAAAVASITIGCSAPLLPHLLYCVLYNFTSPVSPLRPKV
jgi:hypothetical protein